MKKLILKSHVLFLCATFSAGLYAVIPLEGEAEWEALNQREEKRLQTSNMDARKTIEVLRREAKAKREVLRHEALLKD